MITNFEIQIKNYPCLGKDIGKSIITDLQYASSTDRTTGSGKSVGVNSMIISLLYSILQKLVSL